MEEQKKSSTRKIVEIILIPVLSIGLIIMFFKNAFLSKEIKRLKSEKDAAERLLKVVRVSSFDTKLKNELVFLIKKYEGINVGISKELISVIKLLSINETEKAIKSMVKVLENILKMEYENDADFNDWLGNKKISLHYMLDYAKEKYVIDAVDYKFFMAIKEIRNKESHETGVYLDEYIKVSSIITSIGGVIKLGKIRESKLINNFD